MHLQPISSQFPNIISITRVREDIDALTELLEKYRAVKVLKGQEILFEATRPETEEEARQRKLRAMESIMRAPVRRRKNGKSLARILIKEREEMRSGAYE